MNIDITMEAINIIREHTNDFMMSADYTPTDSYELYETMVEECSHYLTMGLLNKKYTPMEYNAIRNEIASNLYDIFKEHI